MTNLLAELRSGWGDANGVCLRAADEIERLNLKCSALSLLLYGPNPNAAEPGVCTFPACGHRDVTECEPASREVRMECLYCPARFMTAWELEVHEKEHAVKSRELHAKGCPCPTCLDGITRSNIEQR